MRVRSPSPAPYTPASSSCAPAAKRPGSRLPVGECALMANRHKYFRAFAHLSVVRIADSACYLRFSFRETGTRRPQNDPKCVKESTGRATSIDASTDRGRIMTIRGYRNTLGVVAVAAWLAACAPLPAGHRYASAGIQKNGCERVAPTGSRLRSATRCNWGRYPDSYDRRERLSQGRMGDPPYNRQPSSF